MSSSVTPPSRDDAGLLSFAQKLMTILDEGRTTATYKYAVLLGLMDLCLEKTSAQGSAPAMVTTRELADKLVDLYWSHAVPYPAGQVVLKQNSKGQAEILSLIVRFRSRAPVVEALNARQARRMDPPGYEALVRAVEFKLAEMPLPRLQRVGSEVDEFLYRVSFQDPARAVTRPSQMGRDDFDNRILFVTDAAEKLVALSPLLRPLVQREWTALVARFNRFPEAELEDFLFGCQRTPTRSLKVGLRDIQTTAASTATSGSARPRSTTSCRGPASRTTGSTTSCSSIAAATRPSARTLRQRTTSSAGGSASAPDRRWTVSSRRSPATKRGSATLRARSARHAASTSPASAQPAVEARGGVRGD